MNTIVLKPGRERSVKRKHPWIFSGAIARVVGKPANGETVRIADASGQILAIGAYSPHSQIRVRIWDFSPNTQIDGAFFEQRVQAALHKREQLQIPEQTDAYRLISAEADGLPGLIVDRYAEFLVVQFLSAGVELWKDTFLEILQKRLSPAGIYERSDVNVRKKEGLSLRQGILYGMAPPDLLEIFEGDLRFFVDVKNGHKTGFYLDQRDNRALVAKFAQDREVLNCFAYTGGFGLAALKGGAKKVMNVEAVADLLPHIEQNARLNHLNEDAFQNLKGDVFKVLRDFSRQGQQFDLIVLDPPKFIEKQQDLNRAARGYKDINLQAFKVLRPGGLLFTFSCSGLMKPELFRKIVADAAIDAGRDAQILRFLTQAPDHPIASHIPESQYLKGLLLRVD